MEFHCRLGADTGKVVEGTYFAETEKELRQELEKQGLFILSLRRQKVFNRTGFRWPEFGQVSSADFIIFNQELAALLASGMPLLQCLDILRNQADNPRLGSLVDSVYSYVKSGASLSEAFESGKAAVPGIYIASLLAGEKSGSLEKVIRRYVVYAKLMSDVKRKTISALIYPCILLALSLLVVAVIVLRVVPEFSDFYGGMGATLPFATLVLVNVSNILIDSSLYLLGGALLSICSIVVWLRRPAQKEMLDLFVLRLPVIGAVAKKFSTAQFVRTLATLLGGGIPLVSALSVSARSVGNRHFRAQIGHLSREVESGQALSEALAGRKIFPRVAVKMIEVGESTGSLQDMLDNTADFFDERVETALSRFITVVEPLLLVIMGVVIATLLLVLYWPLLQIGAVVQ